MPNFGKYAILGPTVYTFKKEPDWHWKIKPPAIEEEIAISRFINTGSVTQKIDGIQKEQVRTTVEIAVEEVSLLFAGTNIPADVEKPVSEGGAPFVAADAEIYDVKEAVKRLPPDMLYEIWGQIGEVVPGWGPYNSSPKNSKTAQE